MSLTFGQVSRSFLQGDEVSWNASGASRAGVVRLSEPGERRLFNFLLGSSPRSVAEGSETLFAGLISAWRDEESDPIPDLSEEAGASADEPWRLQILETTNFGGLNTYGGPPFRLEVEGDAWCLEGNNGSGKTQLASSIIWALTGNRIHEHDGPQMESGVRAPVYDDAGTKIGTWPSFVTFPPTSRELTDTARVSVRLEFQNGSGERALASRELIAPSTGDPSIDAAVDSRLLESPELIESGLLMPARLGHISFASKSASLYEAVKMLTGLDQLSGIAQGAAAFTNRGRRFLKYSRDQNIDGIEEAFTNSLRNARDLADQAGLVIPESVELGSDELLQLLESLSLKASTQAGELLALLKSDIAEDIDLGAISGRERLSRAINTARVFIDSGTKDLPLFRAWKALKNATADQKLENLSNHLPEFEKRLEGALKWHGKQLLDERFRLKALAARFYLAPDGLTDSASCPLCAPALEYKRTARIGG